MDYEDFSKLKIGDRIKHIRTGEIYVVTGHTCEGYIIAITRETTDSCNWELIEEFSDD